MSSLEAIRYSPGQLSILNQLKLPLDTKYVLIESVEDGWNAIKSMQVRGAPAIAIVGCLSLAVAVRRRQFGTAAELQQFAGDSMRHLLTARPTAVNLQDAAARVERLLAEEVGAGAAADRARERLLQWLESQLEADVALNRRLSEHGAEAILRRCGDRPSLALVTICNTGSLATAGYGTALGVVRSLHARGRLAHIYCCETRPYNQGARLTAFEVVHEAIPGTLIADSMVAALMQRRHVDAVVVGADRIVANGDFANKIGTCQLAIVARHHGVPFYVAAPSTTFDFGLAAGAQIVIEERPEEELTSFCGQRVAAPGIKAWNPAFDVTPAELITGGVINEFGVFSPAELEEKVKPRLGL